MASLTRLFWMLLDHLWRVKDGKVHSPCGSVVPAVVAAFAVFVVAVVGDAVVVVSVVMVPGFDFSQIGTLHFSHLIHLVVV